MALPNEELIKRARETAEWFKQTHPRLSNELFQIAARLEAYCTASNPKNEAVRRIAEAMGHVQHSNSVICFYSDGAKFSLDIVTKPEFLRQGTESRAGLKAFLTVLEAEDEAETADDD